MNFKGQLSEVVKTTVPVIILLLVLDVVLVGAGAADIANFLACGVLVILGFTLFLLGVDIGVIPMGAAVGAEIPRRNSVLFMIAVVFVVSFAVTVAEPDVNVFSTHACSVFAGLDPVSLIIAIAFGVAVFLVIAALRIITNVSIRVIITIGYAIVVVLAIFSPDTFMGIAFDSGGVTTGPMTVPVLIALGLGICSVVASRSELDSFGMVGLASIGPIIAILVYGLIADPSVAITAPVYEAAQQVGLIAELKGNVTNVALAIAPLYLFFIIFQKFFLKCSWKDFKIMSIGIAISALGMILFLSGVSAGFMPIAEMIGKELINADAGIMILAVGMALGFMVVIAEPAVKILGTQVEQASQGIFSKKLITVVMAIGVSVFVGVSMYLLSQGDMSVYFLLPMYAVAIVLMWLTDKDLVGITFDAGGVATGPMSVAVIMTMYSGMACALYTGADAVINGFGIVAMIALAPLISLSILGIMIRIYKRKNSLRETS